MNLSKCHVLRKFTARFLNGERHLFCRDCCQIHGVCLSGQSVIFTDTKSHALKRFSFEAALLDGTNKIQKVDTIIGNGTSGTKDGLISVGGVSYPTAIIAEHGTIFFVDTSSKSVRLVTKVSALIKYI